MTLSSLLNAIDGVGATDGRILVLSTNRKQVLDEVRCAARFQGLWSRRIPAVLNDDAFTVQLQALIRPVSFSMSTNASILH